jgi:hypothetical protein
VANRKNEALLCYCLVNTPLEIVEDEIRREHWKHFKIDEDAEIREYVEKKHNFDHLPKKTKVKVLFGKYNVEQKQFNLGNTKQSRTSKYLF